MHDIIDLGSSPAEEGCAQVGTDDYETRALRECREYIAVLRRAFGPEPPGCRLRVKRNPHDFGVYLSVEVLYDPESKEAADYANGCDSKAPMSWDDEARTELGLSGKSDDQGGEQ